MGLAGVGQDLPQDGEDLGCAKHRRVAVFVLVGKAPEGASRPPALRARNDRLLAHVRRL